MSYARAISRPRMGRAILLPGIVQLQARRLTILPYLGNSMHMGSPSLRVREAGSLNAAGAWISQSWLSLPSNLQMLRFSHVAIHSTQMLRFMSLSISVLSKFHYSKCKCKWQLVSSSKLRQLRMLISSESNLTSILQLQANWWVTNFHAPLAQFLRVQHCGKRSLNYTGISMLSHVNGRPPMASFMHLSVLHSVYIWRLLPQIEALIGLCSLAQVHGQAVISKL